MVIYLTGQFKDLKVVVFKGKAGPSKSSQDRPLSYIGPSNLEHRSRLNLSFAKQAKTYLSADLELFPAYRASCSCRVNKIHWNFTIKQYLQLTAD